MIWIFIFLGGGLGAVSRYGVGLMAGRYMGIAFPFGTLMVNVIGSFLIGFLLTWLDSRLTAWQGWKPLLAIGFMGGFTTFSSFSWETLQLFRNGEWLYALVNVGGSVLLCLIGVAAGHLAAKWIGG